MANRVKLLISTLTLLAILFFATLGFASSVNQMIDNEGISILKEKSSVLMKDPDDDDEEEEEEEEEEDKK